MARFVTLSGPAHFNTSATGVLDATDAHVAFAVLLRQHRQAVHALREINAQIEQFLEDRLRHDKRLASQLRGELLRARESDG